MSIEDQLSSIEEQYQKAFVMLSNIAFSASTLLTKYRTTEYVSKAIKTILVFQRSIELLFEDVRKLSDEKTKFYIDRCNKNIGVIRISLRGSPLYLGVCMYIDSANYDQAFFEFRKIRSFMYQIFEDIRLIYALRIYPIEEKMALKSTLTDYEFVEVTKCLDEAESNLAMRKPEHLKDCVDRSREALEKLTSSMLTSLKKKPSGYFSTDIGTLSGLGVIDKETKKLTEATYSYLSEVGAHGRAGEVTLSNAHFAMKETYMRIDILLKKYAEHLTKKSKAN